MLTCQETSFLNISMNRKIEKNCDLPGVCKVEAGLGGGEASCWPVAGESLVSFKSPIATLHFVFLFWPLQSHIDIVDLQL